MSTPICHFLIGVPGSGKSTFATKLAQLGNCHIISTDAVREKLYGDAAIQGTWEEIEANIISAVVNAITDGVNVIYDATNAKRIWRLDLLEKLNVAVDFPVLWMGWYLTTPLEICKQWNQKRCRQVPEHIIDNMYQSLLEFPPIAGEGFVLLKEVDLTSPKFDFQQIVNTIKQLDRTIINRSNRNSQMTFHAYSKLLDFERLMYLISVIIKYPGIGNLQTNNPKILTQIFGYLPEFSSSVEEISGFINQLHGKIYADQKSITQDLIWLQNNSLIGVNNISQIPQNTINGGDYIGNYPSALVTHPYSDLTAFQRLLSIIRLIFHHPFLLYAGEGSLKTLVAALPKYENIHGHSLDSVRKDIEKVLKPYQILPEFSMRDGYFAGSGILSALELQQIFQVLESQAKSLNDPIALEIYEKFASRMEKSKLGGSEIYQVRAIANRSMIDTKYLPKESLIRNIQQLEEAIYNRELLELNRFPGGGKFAKDEEGFFLAFPLQIVFSNYAWYLGYELMSGENKGLLRFERLDRLFIGKPQIITRSQTEQETALNRLQQLSEICGSIFVGYNHQEQKQFLDGNNQERSQLSITVELWFNDAMFKFIAEGTKRFPQQQMKMSLPTTGRKSNLPKSIFSLKPTGDNQFPNRFQVTLPKWCLNDIELLRWILGFKAGVKVVKPKALVEEIKRIGEDIVNIY
ncbi:MAG: WYL domain-containing protein [Nostocales cyanobacterium]|nr:MAG: WYL domain-containing protein [Nostocales cyanobacterium]